MKMNICAIGLNTTKGVGINQIKRLNSSSITGKRFLFRATLDVSVAVFSNTAVHAIKD